MWRKYKTDVERGKHEMKPEGKFFGIERYWLHQDFAGKHGRGGFVPCSRICRGRSEGSFKRGWDKVALAKMRWFVLPTGVIADQAAFLYNHYIPKSKTKTETETRQ